MTTIYHNPRCSTSRAALDLLREKGMEPDVVEYLERPLTAKELAELIARAGLTVRGAMRSKEAVYKELGLDAPGLSDEQLLHAIQNHPILLNRPFVVTDKGTRLARPISVLDEIL